MAYLLTTAGDRYTSLVAITLISSKKVKGYSPSAALALRWVNKMSIASLMTSHSASNSTTHSTQSNLNPAAISFLRVEELRKICYCCWHLYCTYWRNLTKCGPPPIQSGYLLRTQDVDLVMWPPYVPLTFFLPWDTISPSKDHTLLCQEHGHSSYKSLCDFSQVKQKMSGENPVGLATFKTYFHCCFAQHIFYFMFNIY